MLQFRLKCAFAIVVVDVVVVATSFGSTTETVAAAAAAAAAAVYFAADDLTVQLLLLASWTSSIGCCIGLRLPSGSRRRRRRRPRLPSAKKRLKRGFRSRGPNIIFFFFVKCSPLFRLCACSMIRVNFIRNSAARRRRCLSNA